MQRDPLATEDTAAKNVPLARVSAAATERAAKGGDRHSLNPRRRPRRSRGQSDRIETLCLVVGHCFDLAIEHSLDPFSGEDGAWWAPVVDCAAIVCKRFAESAADAGRGSKVMAHIVLFARIRGNVLKNANFFLDGVPRALSIASMTQSLQLSTLVRTTAVRHMFKPLLDRAVNTSFVFARRGALCRLFRESNFCISRRQVANILEMLPPALSDDDVPPFLRVMCLAIQVVVAQICDANAVERCFRADCARPAISCGCPSTRVRCARLLPWRQFVAADSTEQRYWRGCAVNAERARVAVCSESCLCAYTQEVQARVPLNVQLVPRGETHDLHAACDALMKRNRSAMRDLRDAPSVSGHLRSSHVAQLRRELIRVLNVDLLLAYAASIALDGHPPRPRTGAEAFVNKKWRRNFKYVQLQLKVHALLKDNPDVHLLAINQRLGCLPSQLVLSQVWTVAHAMLSV